MKPLELRTNVMHMFNYPPYAGLYPREDPAMSKRKHQPLLNVIWGFIVLGCIVVFVGLVATSLSGCTIGIAPDGQPVVGLPFGEKGFQQLGSGVVRAIDSGLTLASNIALGVSGSTGLAAIAAVFHKMGKSSGAAQQQRAAQALADESYEAGKADAHTARDHADKLFDEGVARGAAGQLPAPGDPTLVVDPRAPQA